MALGRAFIEIHADTRPFRKDLDKGVQDTFKQVAPKIGKTATEGITQGLKAFRFIPGTFQGVLITGLSALIIATAPAIATALQGAFTAAAGLAGLGAGIALAISASPGLKEAGATLGRRLLEGLQAASTSLVTPIKKAMEQFAATFDAVLPQIQSGFDSLAPSVAVLANGISAFVANVMPGLIQAFKNSGPAIEVLGEQLAILGTTLSSAFESLTDDPETTIQGLRLLFGLLNNSIKAVVITLDILGNLFEAYVATLDFVAEKTQNMGLIFNLIGFAVDRLNGPMTGLRKITQDNAGALDSLSGAFSNAAVQGNGLIETVRELYGIELSVSEAAIRVEETIDGVTASFKENGDTLKINSEEGRENVRVVNEVIRAALAEHEAMIAAGVGVNEANDAYRDRLVELRKTLEQAGLTKTEIDKLIGAYEKVPDGVQTNVTAPGIAGILSQAQALARTLQSIRSQQIAINRAGLPGGGGVGGLAEGGVITSPTLSWVGEAGAEAVVPLTDPKRANQVLAEAGIGGTTVVYLMVDGEVIERRVVRHSQNEARRLTFNPRTV